MTGNSQSNQGLARELLTAGGAAALATIGPSGGPFASHVVTASSPDGAPLMLLSRLAEHTKNLERNPCASLLFVREPAAGEEAMTATRLTLVGRCVSDPDPQSRSSYLDRHPDAARYADFADFSIYRFEIESGHLVAGFGRIVPMSREALILSLGGGVCEAAG
jgi:putative heme iron utilization protein